MGMEDYNVIKFGFCCLRFVVFSYSFDVIVEVLFFEIVINIIFFLSGLYCLF